jgi:hypothetical protein
VAVTLEQARERLARLALPAGEYALHGSGPLLAHGLVDSVGDLDVVARGAAWARALELGRPVPGRQDLVVALPGDLEVWSGWLDEDVDELIDGAETVAGLPCVRLERVLAFKEALGRPKDRHHIELLRRHLGRAP